MQFPKNEAIESLLNIFSVKEIVQIFTSIDEKISKLNECSSEDFLQFNMQLRRYFKDAELISANAKKTFDVIAGDDNERFFEELESFHEQFVENLSCFEMQLNHSIRTLEKIQINLNLLIVPFNNFYQNLMTLKFLFTNLKFNITYLDQSYSRKINSQTDKIDQLIKTIKDNYPTVNQNLSSLKSAIKQTIKKLRRIKEQNAMHSEAILNQINLSSSFLRQKHHKAVGKVPELTTKTANCFDSISNIITQLQVQDIVRQKMEHIQVAHREIISELNNLEDTLHEGGSGVEPDLDAKARCFIKIKDISSLQVAQLIYTNKEYQKAIETISNKFLEVGESMTDISSMCMEFSGYSQGQKPTHYRVLIEKLQGAVKTIDHFEEINTEYVLEVDTIHVDIEKISAFFKNIFDLEKRLEELAANTVKITGDSEFNERETGMVLGQIKSLFSDAYIINSNLEVLFGQTLNLSLGLLGEEFRNNKLAGNHSGLLHKNLTKLSTNIEELLYQIEQKNHIVSTLLRENAHKAEKVYSDIRNSFEAIKYYQLFETEIESIIGKLNNIHHKLKLDSGIEGLDASSLDYLKKLYTVNSEYLVHQKESTATIAQEDAEAQDEEGDLELF